MARVRDLVPDVVYVIAGRTHPEIVRTEGEKYREGLKRRVPRARPREQRDLPRPVPRPRAISLGCSQRRTCSAPRTCTATRSCPARSRSRSPRAGRRCRRPYRYAEDLLSDGAGRLVPFGEAEPLADALTELLVKPEALEEAREAARRAGASLSWPEVGRQTAAVLRDAIEVQRARRAASRRVPRLHGPRRPDSAVRTSTAHLRAMVDETGIYQHADGRVPALEHGYCVDDVARFLPRRARAGARQMRLGRPTSCARSRSSALRATVESAAMRNFLSWDRKWLDEPHDGDHVGRTIWALGELLGRETDPALRAPADTLTAAADQWARRVEPVDPHERVRRPRLGGVGSHPPRFGDCAAAAPRAVPCVSVAARPARGRGSRRGSPTTTRRLCEALIRGGAQVADDTAVGIGLASLEWLDALCSDSSGVYRFPGNVWVAEGDRVADSGDEQPLEALAPDGRPRRRARRHRRRRARRRCIAVPRVVPRRQRARDGARRLQHRSVPRRARPRAELQLRRRVHARVPATRCSCIASSRRGRFVRLPL